MKKRIGMLLLAATLLVGSAEETAFAATKTTQKTVKAANVEKEEVQQDLIIIQDEENPLEGIMDVTAYQKFTGTAMDFLGMTISKSVETAVKNEQNKPSYTDDDLMYMTCIIYCEAGDQDFTGMVAVANVIQNRVESKMFDHVTTIKEVIYDCNRWGRQFSPVYVKKNGKWTTSGAKFEKVLQMYRTGEFQKDWQKRQLEDCQKAALAALMGETVIPSEYLYFNMGITSTKAKCNKNGKSYTVIGCHIFY